MAVDHPPSSVIEDLTDPKVVFLVVRDDPNRILDCDSSL